MFSLLIILAFFGLYTIKFSFLPVSASLILYPFLVIYLFVKRRKFISKIFSFPVFGVLLLLLYSLIISCFSGDFEIPYNFLVWLVVFIPEAFVCSSSLLLLKQKNVKLTIYHLISLVVLIQSIFIFISFFSQTFIELTNLLLKESDQVWTQSRARVKGFTSGGGATLSLIQGIGASTAFMLFSQKKNYVFLLISIITFISTFFTGRTGLIFYVLFISIYFTYCLFIHKIKWKSFILGISIGIITLTCFYTYLIDEDSKEYIEDKILSRSFDIFQTILGEETLAKQSIQTIIEMYSVPKTLTGLIFGEGYYTLNNENYVGDPGYIKYLYYFGILGCLFYYLFFLMLMKQTVKYLSDKTEKMFIIVVYLLFFLVESKEPFFAKVNVILFMFYFWALITKTKTVLTSSKIT